MSTVTPDPIFQLAQGFMASKMLFAAGDIGLFEQLGDGPLTLEEIAARLNLRAEGVMVVANAMVAVGLLEIDNGRYRNSPVAQTFLAGKTPADFRPLLKFWDRLSYPGWLHLGDAVRRARPTETAFHFSEEEQAIFSAGVEAASSGGAQALAATYDFSHHQKLLDVAGGTGSFIKTIRRRHPHIEGTLFELPRTAAYAKSRFTPDDAAHISVVEGDLLRDPWPTGHDAILLAHILHGFSVDDCRHTASRAHDAAPKDGRLLIVEFFLDETRTAPLPGVLMSGEFFIHTGAGRSYSTAEVSGWLRDAGWKIVSHQPLAGPVSVLIAEKR